MALKTFNLDKEIYEEFSGHCKKNGISMSKKIENFIRQELRNIKAKGSDIGFGDFRLEIEKDVRPKTLTSLNPEEHPMGKYC